MRRLCLSVVALAFFVPGSHAYESDVHFGLTKWLALQAGYTPQQADAIATGDQRVDSGEIQFMEVMTAYACLGNDSERATRVGLHHFPSAGRIPAATSERTVAPGSEAARKGVLEISKFSPQQSGFLLLKLGAAVHALQDSWAHQGITDVPPIVGSDVACDAGLVWAHPLARGGWNSHKADLTQAWPSDVVAMARATYEALLGFPAIDDAKRTPKEWNTIKGELDGFVRAATKLEKQQWFGAHGLDDVSFLDGISLPDGKQAFTLRWSGRKLPPLPTLKSTQHHVDPGLLAFMSDFFMQWATTRDFDGVAARFAVPNAARGKLGTAASAMDRAELSARLRAWRIRDHGRVADIAHALTPLSARQRATVAAIANDEASLARYGSPEEAYFPLVVPGSDASPLLGFRIAPMPPSTSGVESVLAVAKLRHAPYDTVEVIARRVDGAWRIASIGAVVEH